MVLILKYIFLLLFFKRLSDTYDEEYRIALDGVRSNTTNVGLAIEKALRGIEQSNQQFLYSIFGMYNESIKTN